ncbi:ATP-binding protein [Gaetbulibacter sp. M235]|uniref:sensor histidine kinase n=1 Tax=Gaetbulibacter sp. M235 TaxID=3126510 RepID=UPI00374F5E73
MNDSKLKWILYFIACVILGTVWVQLYWNYKNYLSSKQQLINEVQLSLDTAIENYFANLAKKNTLEFAFTTDNDTLSNDIKLDSIIKNIQIFTNKKNHLDTLKDIHTDTIIEHLYQDESNNEWYSNKVILKKTSNNSIHKLHLDSFKTLTSKVLISMTNDSLNLETIDSLLHEELQRKQLNITYGLTFKKDSTTIQKTTNHIDNDFLSVSSKSTFLPKFSELKIHFTNETKIILKRILSSILISLLLILAVISCLFYLLKIIKNQKQLAEVKNDLISNITHEFKTPIATIGVAIESIKNFNVIDDKEKTKSYLDMSSNQLSKLNVMVEKLLETATLDGDSLQLNKEYTNITDLISMLVNKHSMQTNNKTISLKSEQDAIIAKVDVFHFENTINNILDNAIKYGGNTISIHLSQTPIAFTVSISDNGNTLTKSHKEKIFEKFYRVPKGNTHDVKGFGIGLYYSKKIAEKHGGIIHLDLNKSETTFKISLPNE